MLKLAEDYSRAAINQFGEAMHVDTKALDPRALPSFWFSALIHVARIGAVLIGGTSPTGKRSAGQLDLLHLDEAAAYADVFVTNDRGLRSFASTVKGLRCKVVSFEEWAALLSA